MKEFKHILFREDNHTYQNVNTGKFYISVTTKIKQYEPVFRSYYWAAYKTLQDQGYKQLIPDSASYVPNDYIKADGINIHMNDVNDVNIKLNEWKLKSKAALEKGNFIHLYMEMRAHRKIIPVPKKFKVYQDVMEQYFKDHKSETIATELIIGDDETNVAGQIDYLREPLWITDYKSDEEIKYENEYESFKYPFHEYDHTNFNKYCFQINTYRYIFEKNTGKKIKGMEVVSITDKGYQIIPIPRIQEPIKEMLYDNRRINFKHTS